MQDIELLTLTLSTLLLKIKEKIVDLKKMEIKIGNAIKNNFLIEFFKNAMIL